MNKIGSRISDPFLGPFSNWNTLEFGSNFKLRIFPLLVGPLFICGLRKFTGFYDSSLWSSLLLEP